MNIAAQELLLGFPRALRAAGLAIDPSRVINFLCAVNCAPLRELADLARVGRVTLTSSPDDFPVFDEVFMSWFAKDPVVAVVPEDEGETEAPKQAPGSDPQAMPETIPGDTSGKDASLDEVLGRKSFAGLAPDQASVLKAMQYLDMPSIRARRWRAAVKGARIDIARTASEARRTFGETLRLRHKARPRRPRKVLVLIDISGSMKIHSEAYLCAVHALVQRGSPVEVFCFGTRLTRVTATLRQRSLSVALARLANLVFDFDGGTRIGDSLQSFLDTSRYAALVRGSVTLVLSDGLERGETAIMRSAVARLARLCHRLVWLTPLARDPRYIPVTRAMAAILPDIDCLSEASDLTSLLHSLAKLTAVEKQPRRQPAKAWSKHRSAA